MATTAIDSKRNSAAMQKYNDAVFMRDDKYLYFGNDGDESIVYDSSADSFVFTSITLNDGTKINFGTDKDFSLNYDATSDSLVLLGVSSDDPGIAGGLFWTSDAGTGKNVLCICAG